VVAIGLFALLAVLLGAGLYANANLRSPGVSIPTPAPAAAAATEPPSTPQPAAPATPQLATPTRVPAATATPPLQPTLAPAVPTAALTPLVQVGDAGATPAVASAATAETPKPLPTVEPTLAAEVSSAYERYWQVRSEALLDLDKTHLSEAMSGDHLASTSQLIDELSGENRAIQTNVDHDYEVIQASEESAEVYDDYLSSSYYVDPRSGKELTDPATDELRVLYQLIHTDGVWKVVDSVRAE
jgi:hypothetical protein